jgi:hypothetical protein
MLATWRHVRVCNQITHISFHNNINVKAHTIQRDIETVGPPMRYNYKKKGHGVSALSRQYRLSRDKYGFKSCM